jgi:hypothetical protein
VVVELLVKRLPSVEQPLKVDVPTGRLVDGARHGELDAEAVPVQARALVPRGDLREAVRRLEPELVHESNLHGKAAAPARNPAMYIVLSKKPRKVNRNKSNRYRAKLKAKDTGRRKRVYQQA